MNDYIETPDGSRVRLTLPTHIKAAAPAPIARGDAWFLPLGATPNDSWLRPDADHAA